MVALVVILTILIFITADYGVRTSLARKEALRKRRERAEALSMSLSLQFADEAKSLKRVEVADPKARILAVDDEEVVLDSLRKILVLSGYSVDTVEHGPEALTLVQERDYDFVFTDLKMPDMDGVDVVKGVKHIRPDTDVIVITGFATVETAVETMKVGAMDYVQKPFTEEELTKLVGNFVIRRQDRLAREAKPLVRLVTPSAEASDSPQHYNVLSGIFISPSHVWIGIEPNGAVVTGLDDLAQKILGRIDAVSLPDEGASIAQGDVICKVQQHGKVFEVISPVSGYIEAVNFSLEENPALINASPYASGWLCRIAPENLSTDLPALRIGASAISWYQKEVDALAASGTLAAQDEARWDLAVRFLRK